MQTMLVHVSHEGCVTFVKILKNKKQSLVGPLKPRTEFQVCFLMNSLLGLMNVIILRKIRMSGDKITRQGKTNNAKKKSLFLFKMFTLWLLFS